MVSIRDIWLDMKGVLLSARRIINTELGPLNLSSAEGDILFLLLTGSNTLQQEQLAEQLDIGKAAVSRAIDSLETKGYVIRIKQHEDKRAYSVCLTDRAFLIGADIKGIYNKLYMLARKGISDEELIYIRSLLSCVASNLQLWEDR
jgi:DNA-binding MarR family transcriptional regulator